MDCYHPKMSADSLQTQGQPYGRLIGLERLALTFAGRMYLARLLAGNTKHPQITSGHCSPQDVDWHQIGGIGRLLPQYLEQGFDDRLLTPQNITDDFNRLPYRICM
jgi:hypothetical protein